MMNPLDKSSAQIKKMELMRSKKYQSHLQFDQSEDKIEKYISYEIIIKDTGMGISKEG